MEQDSPKEMASPGQLLREARENIGLSRHEVARELKLTPDIIYSIENDDFSVFSADLYVRGQLLNYAGVLEIEAGPVLQAWQQRQACTQWSPPQLNQGPALTAVPVAQSGTKSSHWAVKSASYAIGFVAFAMTFLWWQEQQPWQPLTDAERLIAAMIEQDNHLTADKLVREIEFVGLLEKYSPEIFQVDAIQSEISTVPMAQETVSAVDQPVLPPSAKVRVIEPSQDTLQAYSLAMAQFGVPAHPFESNSATFNFDEDSWVEVVDGSGKRLMYELVGAGNKIVVRGRPPYNIHLGNAAGVTVEYDGEVFDHSKYIRHRTARFKLGAVDVVGNNS